VLKRFLKTTPAFQPTNSRLSSVLMSTTTGEQ